MINSSCLGAIVASQANKVNHKPTDRSTERGMILQFARDGKSAIKKRGPHFHLHSAPSSTGWLGIGVRGCSFCQLIRPALLIQGTFALQKETQHTFSFGQSGVVRAPAVKLA